MLMLSSKCTVFNVSTQKIKITRTISCYILYACLDRRVVHQWRARQRISIITKQQSYIFSDKQRSQTGCNCFVSVAGLAICEYGALPGMMEHLVTSPFSLTWTLFDPNCQLKDEISRFLGPPPWLFKDRTQGYEVWAANAHTLMVPNFGPKVRP